MASILQLAGGLLLGQQPLSKIHPFLQLTHVVTQLLQLVQHLGLRAPRSKWLRSMPDAIREGLTHRADRQEKQGSTAEDERDGENAFYVHGSRLLVIERAPGGQPFGFVLIGDEPLGEIDPLFQLAHAGLE